VGGGGKRGGGSLKPTLTGLTGRRRTQKGSTKQNPPKKKKKGCLVWLCLDNAWRFPEGENKKKKGDGRKHAETNVHNYSIAWF